MKNIVDTNDTQIGNESPFGSVSCPKYIPGTASNENSGKNDISRQVKVEIAAEEKSKLTGLIFGLEMQTTYERRIQNPVRHLRWNLFAKIVDGF